VTPIFLFTDFTNNGPQVGQLHTRIAADADPICVIDLMERPDS
jgi:hypothetical protein